jgi:predicted DNA-binding transcriptional regulator YafY
VAAQKLERVLKLLAELLNAESPRTADELRNKIKMYPNDLKAFRRAFNRDKNALKEMGVPIVVVSVGASNKDSESYYVDNKEYYLPDLNLDDQELAALNYAANSVHLLDQITEEEALRKLGGYSEATGTEKSNLRVSIDNNLTLLFESLNRKNRVNFLYRDKLRTVEPYLLQFVGGKWYLTANVLEEETIKSFRTDRMSDVTVNPQAHQYSIPDQVNGANLVSFSYGDDPPIKAIVRIDNSYVPWVEQNLDVNVDRGPDGSGIAEFSVLNYDIFIDRVLLLLNHAEILEPPILRERIIKRLQMIRDGGKVENA